MSWDTMWNAGRPPQQTMMSGGGFLGALGGAAGKVGSWAGNVWGGMDPNMQAYMVASGIGGIADYLERRGQREEEKRRYEEAMAEDRRHRQRMGENLQQVWGGGY